MMYTYTLYIDGDLSYFPLGYLSLIPLYTSSFFLFFLVGSHIMPKPVLLLLGVLNEDKPQLLDELAPNPDDFPPELDPNPLGSLGAELEDLPLVILLPEDLPNPLVPPPLFPRPPAPLFPRPPAPLLPKEPAPLLPVEPAPNFLLIGARLPT